MMPQDVPCQDDEPAHDDVPGTSQSVQSTVKPKNAQLCREMIDKIKDFIYSNSTNETLLSQAESVLTDAYEFFSSDPPISVLLNS